MRFHGTAVLSIGLTLLGPTDLLPVQFSPPAADWHMRSTNHFQIYYTAATDLTSIGREAERAYARVSQDTRREISGRVPLILVPTIRDLPHTEREASVIVIASGAPNRDHVLLPIEPRSGREKMLTHELTHVFEFEGHR